MGNTINMQYPFRLRINNSKMENILDRLMKDRTVTIEKDKSITRSLGHNLKPIRQDISIGWDFKTNDTIISFKNPMLRLEKQNAYANKKGKDYIFKI